MDKSVPAPAALILAFVYETETGKKPPACYEVIYGQNQSKLSGPLTKMTLNQVQAAQPGWTKRFGSSAAGAGQIMRDTMDKPRTMADLEGEMGLTGDELFDANMQDRMCLHLLRRRGYDQFIAGRIGPVAFAKRLAQEWASFPVLQATQGAHRRVNRGQSYYAGDGVNKALVTPERIERLLTEALAMTGEGTSPPAPRPAEDRPAPSEAITDVAVVRQVQARLFELGYTEVGSREADGTFDGKVGRMTRAAILAFRDDADLPLVSYIDQELRLALLDAKPRELAPARTEAKPAVVREQVPEARAAWWTKIGAWVLGVPAAIGTVVSGVLDNLDGSRGFLEPVKQFAGDVPPWMWFVGVGAIAFFLWQNSRKGEQASVAAFQTGERR
jgi:muramidase (phage lysozyme)/peptidoglycan hydrolase-like protein with peptidoglycan-binding domain